MSEPSVPAPSPGRPRRAGLTPAQLMTVVCAAAAFLLIDLQPLWHTDVWGHLRYGEWILDHAGLPDREPFCDLADRDTPLVHFAWLSQGLFAAVFRLGARLAGGDPFHQQAGGVEALRLLYALLVAGRLTLAAWAARRLAQLRRPEVSAETARWIGLAAGVLALVLDVGSLGVLRPQAVAEAVAAGLLVVLAAPRVTWTRSALAIGLVVLWANLHGSFPVGLALVALAGLAQALRPAESSAAARAAVSRWAVLMIAAVLAVSALNPHGPWLFVSVWELAAHPNVADMDEWQRLKLASPMGWAFLGSLALVAGVLLARAVTGRRRRAKLPLNPWRDRWPLALLAVGLGVQTYLHQRMMPWWALVLPWLLAGEFAEISRPAPGETHAVATPGAHQARSWRLALLGALAVWAAVMLSGPGSWLKGNGPTPLQKSLHPATPWWWAEQVRAAHADGRFRGRVFATESQGDYLLWALAPDVPIFVSTHVHLFPPRLWQECQRVKTGQEDWEAILDRRGVTLIISEAELHPGLRKALLAATARWVIWEDEAGDAGVRDPRARRLVAARRGTPAESLAPPGTQLREPRSPGSLPGRQALSPWPQ